MNVDHILSTINGEPVDYILIGGMNFLLRHEPELTFDVDLWVRDTTVNLLKLNAALSKLGAAWGPTERDWAPVPADGHWLERQAVFCLTTDHGAVDVFREVRGLEGLYDECRRAALESQTATGSLSDQHARLPGSSAARAAEAAPDGGVTRSDSPVSERVIYV